MIVVADTSPLNYLLLVGTVDILPALFDRVVVPPAVVVEMQHSKAPAVVRAWAASPPAWLEIIAPQRLAEAPEDLGSGERAAVSLAIEIGADVVLLDDRREVEFAEQLRLRKIGTLGVLELAGQSELIDFGQVVAKLRQTNFRYPLHLIEEALRRNERR
jgi:predicted nucleic acid-binding protein